MSGVTPEPSPARKAATNLGYGSALLVALIVLVAILSGNTTPFGIPSLKDIGPLIPPVAGVVSYVFTRLLLGIKLKTNQ